MRFSLGGTSKLDANTIKLTDIFYRRTVLPTICIENYELVSIGFYHNTLL